MGRRSSHHIAMRSWALEEAKDRSIALMLRFLRHSEEEAQRGGHCCAQETAECKRGWFFLVHKKTEKGSPLPYSHALILSHSQTLTYRRAREIVLPSVQKAGTRSSSLAPSLLLFWSAGEDDSSYCPREDSEKESPPLHPLLFRCAREDPVSCCRAPCSRKQGEENGLHLFPPEEDSGEVQVSRK